MLNFPRYENIRLLLTHLVHYYYQYIPKNSLQISTKLNNSAPPARDVGRPAAVFHAAAVAPAAAPVFTSNGKYRSDGKCGALYPLEDGTNAECDPNSEYWCCSEHGFCGGSQVDTNHL